MSRFIEINGRRIGPGMPTYIVAEMSANHNQDFEQAVHIIEAARAAGADAITQVAQGAEQLPELRGVGVGLKLDQDLVRADLARTEAGGLEFWHARAPSRSSSRR